MSHQQTRPRDQRPAGGSSSPTRRGRRERALSFLRGQRGQLSIRSSFTLITFINITVITYLIVTSWHAINGGNYQQGGTLVFGLTVLLGILAALSFIIIERRVVNPLIHLVKQTNTIQHQQSDALLSSGDVDDEIAKLARAFNQLLIEMRKTYQDLEGSNQQLRKANKQIEDSIQYAGILQRSILPDRQLSDLFEDQYFVLWEPKDIVGGDYYLFHRDHSLCLAGVADCAGHGVPGAMMTMMARAGVDRSIQEVGISSPAQLLRSLDSSLRGLMIDDRQPRSIATSMDMGLVVLDFDKRRLKFAGARISLYWSDGQTIDWISGENRAICDRRKGHYSDHDLELLPGFTYYLTTDGYLDQSGGEHGFAIGSQRFIEWLTENARKPLADQRRAFSESLARFRGNHPQRDDITILSFRFD